MSDTTVTTETPRNEAGQFKPAEPAYGREGLERAAGFVPLPDDSKAEEPEEFGTAKDAAAERLKQLSGSESAIVTHVTGLPNNVTLTPEQATELLIESRKDVDAEDQSAADKKAAQKEIDILRGEKPEPAQTESEPDIEKVLANPKVQAAITERITAAESQREAYSAAIADAGKFAAASLFSEFPEFADLPLDRWANAINSMHDHDPARARAIYGKLQALARVEAASRQFKTEKTAREADEFKAYSTRENARFAEMTKGIPAKEMAAIEAHVPKMLAEHGADVAQFLKAVSNQSTFPRATAEALLVKAARYDLMTQNAKTMMRGVPPVPPVQRPGVAGPRGAERQDTSLAALSAKLSKSGSLKDAVALRLARSKGR